MAVVMLVITGLVALVDWWSVATDRLNIEFMAKPLVMILLIGVALAVDTNDNVSRGLVISALGASLVGDVVLMTPDARFELGLFSFLVAHILYVFAFVDRVQLVPALIAGAAIAVAAALIVPPIVRAVVSQSRFLAVAVVVYMLALSTTAVSAASAGVLVAALGGAAFFVSDALLGWGRFVGPTPGGRKIVMISYHLGQVGLVTWLAAV